MYTYNQYLAFSYIWYTNVEYMYYVTIMLHYVHNYSYTVYWINAACCRLVEFPTHPNKNTLGPHMFLKKRQETTFKTTNIICNKVNQLEACPAGEVFLLLVVWNWGPLGVGWIGVVGSDESRWVGSARLDRNLHWLDRDGTDRNLADTPTVPTIPTIPTVPTIPTITDHPNHPNRP